MQRWVAGGAKAPSRVSWHRARAARCGVRGVPARSPTPNEPHRVTGSWKAPKRMEELRTRPEHPHLPIRPAQTHTNQPALTGSPAAGRCQSG